MMATLCWHYATVIDDSDPVVDNTPGDHKYIFDLTVASVLVFMLLILSYLFSIFTFFVHNFCSPFFDDDFEIETCIFDPVAT